MNQIVRRVVLPFLSIVAAIYGSAFTLHTLQGDAWWVAPTEILSLLTALTVIITAVSYIIYYADK